jgi:hypothetical protein
MPDRAVHDERAPEGLLREALCSSGAVPSDAVASLFRMLNRMRDFIARPVVIGPDECPILHRWPVVNGAAGTQASQGVKPLIALPGRLGRFSIKLHHFLPNADDRDVHDHPWAFWTFVLRGSYDDMKECPVCEGKGEELRFAGRWDGGLVPCRTCNGERVVLRERMMPGKLRFRPAEHNHRTRVGPNGCWTIVVTGDRVRQWGFWRLGRFWTHKQYEDEFGVGMRCE